MNVERVELSNFGSWRELDLALERGVTLISGANGVGKSTILQAIEWALFGATSDAGRLIRRGTDEARVLVQLDVEGAAIIVQRTVRRSGQGAKVTLSLWRETTDVPPDMESISAATTTETQAVLDDLLGVSRELLRASAFSMQGDGAAFCEAAPRDRKRIFASTLGLEFWDALAADAKRDAISAASHGGAARLRLEQLDGASTRLWECEERRRTLVDALVVAEHAEKTAEGQAAELAQRAESARDTRRQHEAAALAERTAAENYEAAEREQAQAAAALERASTAAANAPSVDDASDDAIETARLLSEAETLHAARTRAAADHGERLAQAQRSLADAQAERARAAEKVAQIEQHYGWGLLMGTEEAEHPPCPECGKPLDQPGDEAVLERARESHRSALAAVTAAEHPIGAAHAEIMRLDGAPPAGIPDATLAAARTAAQAAQTRLAEAETIQSLAGSLDDARTRVAEANERQRVASAKLSDAHQEAGRLAHLVGELGDVEHQHASAITAVEQARNAHRQAAAELAAAEAAAKTAEKDAAEEKAARATLAEAELEAAIAGILAAGFGPTGVPAMIVDGVLGDLADEANRVLAELASPIRVDLRSQKLLKTSDRLADTLDIIALMDAQETPWERLSGGEQTRVALALRAALTRLLASKRGARVRMLVIDEPAGLDRDGSEQLAGVLQEFIAAGVFDTILLITHQADLADQVARVVRIEKSPGGESRLAEISAEPLPPEFPSSGSAEQREAIDA